MQTCRAFAEHGVSVHLVALRSRLPDAVDASQIWNHFGISERFRLTRLPTLLRNGSSPLVFQFWATMASIGAALGLILRRIPERATAVYSKSPALLIGFIALRPLLPRRTVLVLELHALPTARAKRVIRRADLVVVSSAKLAAALVRAFRVDENRILLEPPVAPVEGPPLSKADARTKLGLAVDWTIACYTGKMIEEQIDFLLRAAIVLKGRLPWFRLVLVGGNPRAREWVTRRTLDLNISDVVQLAGFVPPAEVRLYQAAADVLLFHMTRSTATWEHATPAKAYDYMAAGRPIVATSFPLFSEVFGEHGCRAVQVTEHDPNRYADAVVQMLEDVDDAEAMARRAMKWVSGRSWRSRTERVLDALESHDGRG
jgi:glycosyltransferase involved in cell wall biosynthesis